MLPPKLVTLHSVNYMLLSFANFILFILALLREHLTFCGWASYYDIDNIYAGRRRAGREAGSQKQRRALASGRSPGHLSFGQGKIQLVIWAM